MGAGCCRFKSCHPDQSLLAGVQALLRAVIAGLNGNCGLSMHHAPVFIVPAILGTRVRSKNAVTETLKKLLAGAAEKWDDEPHSPRCSLHQGPKKQLACRYLRHVEGLVIVAGPRSVTRSCNRDAHCRRARTGALRHGSKSPQRWSAPPRRHPSEPRFELPPIVSELPEQAKGRPTGRVIAAAATTGFPTANCPVLALSRAAG